MSTSEAIGPLLARLRRERGWSQVRFAVLLASVADAGTVTRHEVSRWERGVRVPSRYWRSWIAKVTDVPMGTVEEAAATTRALRSKLPVPGLVLPDLTPDQDLSARVV